MCEPYIYRRGRGEKHYLDEPDGSGFFAEALTAEVEAVFANETCLVRAEAAADAVAAGGVAMYVRRETKGMGMGRCGVADASMEQREHRGTFTIRNHSTNTRNHAPLTTSLAVLAGTREPDSVVRHLLFTSVERPINTPSDVWRWDIPYNVGDDRGSLVRTQHTK